LFVDTCGFTEKVISAFNVPVIVDKTIGEINVDEYDALAIPGGFGEFGFYEEAYDKRFLKLIREFDAKGKIIATICSGAFPLGAASKNIVSPKSVEKLLNPKNRLLYNKATSP